MPRPRTTDALLTLAGVGLSSGLIYWLVFVRPFPLARLYHTIPPVDYAKLTDHSVAGALSYTLAIFALFGGYLIALKALRGLSERTPPSADGPGPSAGGSGASFFAEPSSLV